jgi:hypothetical protein
MRLPIGLTLIAALVTVAVVVIVGQAVLQPSTTLITRADFSSATISPNADLKDDVTIFSYALSHNARVSLWFEAEGNSPFYFRKDELRGAGDYSVQFSGVVDGFKQTGESIEGEILRRLLPDGRYRWHLQAVATESGKTDTRTGALTIQNADAPLPEIKTFTVSPDIFTPNQDGISDRTQINAYLTKAADLTVYLRGANGQQIFIPERKEGRKPGEPGRHQFDYDGGIDQGSEPPPNGDYTVVAIAQDAAGQRIERTSKLTIQAGGDPQAEIAPQSIGVDVVFKRQPYDPRYFGADGKPGQLIAMPDDPQDLSFNAVSIPVGDLLIFKLTVENYSKVPIRTSGPPPGTVYEQDQVAATLGWYDESGAWRVGLDCDTATRDYPWRWAVGAKENLVATVDPFDGKTYYYLPPGARSVVWGAVRMTNLIAARNPQKCWAGLIHEDVEVSIRNSRVGARDIQLINSAPTAGG